MLGFDALGRLALGQGGAASSALTLVATAGSYAITGVSIAFTDKLAPVTGVYSLTGVAATFQDKTVAAAGAYSLTGVSVTFRTAEPAVAGSYALTGKAATFSGAEPAAAGSYAVSGKAAIFAGALPPVSGSYIVTGYASVDLIVMPAAAGAIALTLAPLTVYTLTRTGGDFDQVYGGIGHYLEEVERARQLARITRKTPAPIVQAPNRALQPLPSPEAAPPAPAIDLQAGAAQRMEAQLAAATQAKIQRRRRQEAEILLLAS